MIKLNVLWPKCFMFKKVCDKDILDKNASWSKSSNLNIFHQNISKNQGGSGTEFESGDEFEKQKYKR